MFLIVVKTQRFGSRKSSFAILLRVRFPRASSVWPIEFCHLSNHAKLCHVIIFFFFNEIV